MEAQPGSSLQLPARAMSKPRTSWCPNLVPHLGQAFPETRPSQSTRPLPSSSIPARTGLAVN